MRIAIPYEDGVVCQHFGKAPQFKIFDVQPQGVVESVVIDSEASGHEALADMVGPTYSTWSLGHAFGFASYSGRHAALNAIDEMK